jgi:hypothetical protein
VAVAMARVSKLGWLDGGVTKVRRRDGPQGTCQAARFLRPALQSVVVTHATRYTYNAFCRFTSGPSNGFKTAIPDKTRSAGAKTHHPDVALAPPRTL